jgi:hypothetical protein
MTYLTDLITRACAIEREGFATLTNPLTNAAYNIDAFPRYFATGEAFPYTTHRVTGLPVDHEDNNEYEQFPLPRLVIRVVIAHLATGYAGEPDERIYTYIPMLTGYFGKRKWFQSVALPTRPDYLMYSEVVDAGGFMVFDNRGFAGVSQVGFELVIACRFTEYIEQVYL